MVTDYSKIQEYKDTEQFSTYIDWLNLYFQANGIVGNRCVAVWSWSQ